MAAAPSRDPSPCTRSAVSNPQDFGTTEKFCRLCMKEYTRSHHHHLVHECKARCPFGCADTTHNDSIVEHFNDPARLERHLIAFHDMTARIQRTQAARGQRVGAPRPDMDRMFATLSELEASSQKIQRELEDAFEQMSVQDAQQLKWNLDNQPRDEQKLETLYSQHTRTMDGITGLASAQSVVRKMDLKFSKDLQNIDKRSEDLLHAESLNRAQVLDLGASIDHYYKVTTSGRFIWKIENVGAKIADAKRKRNTSIYSQPFYTHREGYKLRARIFLNGDSSTWDNHISLFLVLMKGEYDQFLKWPMSQLVCFRLINPGKKCEDIKQTLQTTEALGPWTKPTQEIGNTKGHPEFAEMKTVYDPENGFVVEDTIFVEITTTPAPHEAGLSSTAAGVAN